MARYVVDASVAVKWYVPEQGSERAAQWLEGGHELLAPDLLLAEFANILWKKVARGVLAASAATEVLAAFLDTAPVAIYPAAPYTLAALDLAVRYGRTAYDALYLALAVAEDCPLLTADERLVHALQGTPLAPFVRCP